MCRIRQQIMEKISKTNIGRSMTAMMLSATPEAADILFFNEESDDVLEKK